MADDHSAAQPLCEHGYPTSHWIGLPTGNDPDGMCPGPPREGRRRSTMPQERLVRRFMRRGLRGFRVLRSAEAPLIRYRRTDG